MKQPLIAISAERSVQPSAFGPRESTIQVMEYAEAVANAGGRPVIMPATETIPEDILDGFAALILTGGGDLSPEMYGEAPDNNSYGISPIRDKFETALVQYADREELPVLAICRGMQLINVLRGGTLQTHMDGHWQEIPPHEVHHDIEIDKDAHLATLMGSTGSVNSYHHQGIGALGKGLQVTAHHNEDIEAFEDTTKRILAVQWHPEHLASVAKSHRALFEDIVRRGTQHINRMSNQEGTFTNV